MGFINGEPAFGAPARIPGNMGLGWWGFSPWSSQFGVAQVVMREVSGGPLPVTMAAFEPRSEEWSDQELIEAIKPHVKQLQAIAPQWYVQELGGFLQRDYSDPYRDLRLMTRFHQIRLLPAVRSAIPSTLDLDELIRFAGRERVDGFTLLVTRMPEESWFREAERRLLDSNLSLVAMRISDQGVADVREFGPRVGLFLGPRAVRSVVVDDQRETPAAEDETDPVETEESANPSRSRDRILYF